MLNDNLVWCDDESYFDDEELGLTNRELEEKFAKGIELLKAMQRLKGLPTSEYDNALNKPYLLYPDGRREYYNGQ